MGPQLQLFSMFHCCVHTHPGHPNTLSPGVTIPATRFQVLNGFVFEGFQAAFASLSPFSMTFFALFWCWNSLLLVLLCCFKEEQTDLDTHTHKGTYRYPPSNKQGSGWHLFWCSKTVIRTIFPSTLDRGNECFPTLSGRSARPSRRLRRLRLNRSSRRVRPIRTCFY